MQPDRQLLFLVAFALIAASITLISLRLNRPKAKAALPAVNFVYRSNEAFFEYQCRYGITKIEQGRAMVGLVLADLTDAAASAMPGPDACPRIYQILLPNPDMPTSVIAGCGQPGIVLKPDDLVAWMPQHYVVAIGKWHGTIFAKLAAETRNGELVPLVLFPPQ